MLFRLLKFLKGPNLSDSNFVSADTFCRISNIQKKKTDLIFY